MSSESNKRTSPRKRGRPPLEDPRTGLLPFRYNRREWDGYEMGARAIGPTTRYPEGLPVSVYVRLMALFGRISPRNLRVGLAALEAGTVLPRSRRKESGHGTYVQGVLGESMGPVGAGSGDDGPGDGAEPVRDEGEGRRAGILASVRRGGRGPAVP